MSTNGGTGRATGGPVGTGPGEAGSETAGAAGGTTASCRRRGVADLGPWEVLRFGLRVTPELRRGAGFTVALAVTAAGGRLAIPVLLQQALDRGILGPEGFRAGFVYPACAVTAAVVALLYLVSRATYRRLVRASEASLLGLRVRTFDHIHRLSMAEHEGQSRGVLVARVTSDIETLAGFMEWGAVAWVVDTLLVVATLGVMATYDWRLTLVVVAACLPLAALFPTLARRQLATEDRVRSAVGDTLAQVSEAVAGAPLIRAHGAEATIRARLRAVVDRQYRAQMVAARYVAALFPLGDATGAVALAGVVVVGSSYGPGWGLREGEVVAFLFLVGVLLHPVGELSEVLDQTQAALAGWRKVLGVLATPIDLVEPDPGRPLPAGALAVEARGLTFAYSGGRTAVRDVEATVPAGASVAVVGATGSGKTTFAKLLCRLVDPSDGMVTVGGIDLREVAPAARRRAIRLVPQDGFLFDASVADNVRAGRPGASRDEVRRAFTQLGLGWWVERLPQGLDTSVGERGGYLSFGERQLVALARAQLGDPGLLVLDEATSALDPEIEHALSQALGRLAAGRTVVTIAHRLSTAEAADLVLVFDGGRVVEHGRHVGLLAAGGAYARLYAGWLGETTGDHTDDDTL